MSDIEVVAINGLDDAIIGSTVQYGVEVLAYDYDKAVAIIMASGHTEQYAEEFIGKVMSQIDEGTPAFIYIDNDHESYGSSVPNGATVH